MLDVSFKKFLHLHIFSFLMHEMFMNNLYRLAFSRWTSYIYPPWLNEELGLESRGVRTLVHVKIKDTQDTLLTLPVFIAHS